MNFERELAQIEKQLATQDPLLAEKLATFEQITAVTDPRPRGGSGRRRHVFLLAALVLALLALTSTLAAGTSTVHARPSQVVREHPLGSG